MFKLFTKESQFHWNDECQAAFDKLKENISSAPILGGPDWNFRFHISTDSFDSAIGEVLGQKEDPVTHAIYIFSKNLTPVELNYTVTQKNSLL